MIYGSGGVTELRSTVWFHQLHRRGRFWKKKSTTNPKHGFLGPNVGPNQFNYLKAQLSIKPKTQTEQKRKNAGDWLSDTCRQLFFPPC